MQPIRIVRNYVKISDFDEGDPYVYIECVPTIYPVNGQSTPESPGNVIQYEVPDMYGRPWAHDLGEVLGEGHGEAAGRGHLHVQVIGARRGSCAAALTRLSGRTFRAP